MDGINLSDPLSRENKIRFLGSSSCTLSDDGRIVLPQKFRDQLKRIPPYYLCPGFQEGCLWLVPEVVFFPLLDDIKSKIEATDQNGQDFLRMVASNAEEISQLGNVGRLVISPRLRKWAGLEDPKTPVEVIGMVDRIEIWNQKLRREREAGLNMGQLSRQVNERYKL